MEELGLKLIEFLIYLCRAVWTRLWNVGTGTWDQVDGIVTDEPALIRGLATTVEVPYSYRIKGELYTGLHEEPVFLADSEYKDHFTKGRHFVVRVKPDFPEVSTVRQQDQTNNLDSIAK